MSKSAFKFIHAADIHLDSPLQRLDRYEGVPVEAFRRSTRRAFENLIDLARSESVAFVLIAGDLFDGDWKDYNSGLYLVSQMNRLKDAGIPVFITAGNHDAAGTITKSLRFPDNVVVMSSKHPETQCLDEYPVAVHGQSFSMPAVKTDLSKNYPKPVDGHYNIGLLHTCATGREGHEPYAPCSLEGLQSKGYHYWALGHVHGYEVLSENPHIIFCGNTQGRHVRESGAKGCVLVTVEDSLETTHEFRSLDVVRWEIALVDVEGAEDAYAIIDRVGKELEVLSTRNMGHQMAIRVEIIGKTPAHDEILENVERWTNEVRAISLGFGSDAIWIEKIKFNTRSPFSETQVEIQDGAVGELVKLFRELEVDKAARHDLREVLADIERKLPHEMKSGGESLDFRGEEWMKSLLVQARQMLLKQMRGKGEIDEN